jgi:hypothetical protein
MAKAAKINLEVLQGRTFTKTLRWGQPRRTYRQITGATQAAPCILTVPGHGMPDEWAFRISNVRGMTELNADRFYQATVLGPDTIELNDINAAGFKPYQGGGIVTYNTPVDLTGYTGRMQVRPRVESSEVLLDLNTANGGVILDTVTQAITIQMPAVTTAGIDWLEGVYDIELESSGGRVELLAFGAVKVTREVTR